MKDDLKNLREADDFMGELRSHNTELFFKSLAAEYANQKGAEYLAEAEELEESIELDSFAVLRMDSKIKIALMRETRETVRSTHFFKHGAIAAGFIVVCFMAAYFFLEHGNNHNEYNQTGEQVAPSVAGAVDIVETPESYWGNNVQRGMSDLENLHPDVNGFYYNSNDGFGVTTEDDGFGVTTEDDLADTSVIANESANDADSAVEDSTLPTGSYKPEPSNEDDAPEIQASLRSTPIASLAAPSGWRIILSDIQDEYAIYQIESATGNVVNVLAGGDDYDNARNEFEEILLSETSVYILAEDTHSRLVFTLDDVQMVLSTMSQDHSELLELVKFWIE